MNKIRCFGNGPHQQLYAEYHDREWGVAVHDDRTHFEMLSLEGAQAGLNWELILKKREDYRRVFHQFEPARVAEMTDGELEGLLQNRAVVRNRLKIFSVRKNALVFLSIQKEFGTFDHFVWGFVNHIPVINQWRSLKEVPCRSELSDGLSKELKKRKMTFVGSKIIYSYLQAVGLINDHLVDCFCRRSAAGS